MDARFRKKSPKPERSGLCRIDSIEIISGKRLEQYGHSPIREEKRNSETKDDEFIRALAKKIRKKK